MFKSQEKMTKSKFYLRKAAMITACLAVTTVLWGCEKDPTDDNNGNESGKRLVEKVGDIVNFGTYNGKIIQCQALAVDSVNNKALLVSTEIISYWVFNGSNVDVTWETSTVRQWLNSDFYNAVYTSAQKAKILESDIENRANSQYNVGGGVNTKDKVFLLSLAEATMYFSNDAARTIKYNATQAQMEALAMEISNRANSENWHSKPTYAGILADLQSYNGTTDRWWLRTSGQDLTRAAQISYDGSPYMVGGQVFQIQAVRPAIWVDNSPEE